jgi:hypothetical protein
MRSARASGVAEEQAKLIPGRSDKRRPALDWRGLTPRLRRGQRGTVTLTVSVSQLRKLADAMGVVSVTLTVPVGEPRGAILVQPVDPEAEEIGVLLKPSRRPAVARPARHPRWMAKRPRDLEAMADALLVEDGHPEMTGRELK